MGFAKQHARKLFFFATFAACAMIALGLVHSAETPSDPSKAIAILQAALRRHPSAAFEYGDAARNNLNFESFAAVQLPPLSDSISPHVAYPHPARPAVKVFPPKKEPVIPEETAELAGLKEIEVAALPGRNIIKFSIPHASKHIRPTRVEIFRGESVEKINLSAALAVINCDREGKHTAASQFEDFEIDPRKSYAYQLKLIATMTLQPDKVLIDSKAAPYIVRAPRNFERVADSLEYRSALSAPVSVQSAPPYELRFSGMIGVISPDGIPEDRRRSDYKANFAVRVWIKETREWKTTMLSQAPGSLLKGEVLIKDKSTKSSQAHAFDTGLQLVEVKWQQFGDSRKQMLSETAVLRDLSSGELREMLITESRK